MVAPAGQAWTSATSRDRVSSDLTRNDIAGPQGPLPLLPRRTTGGPCMGSDTPSPPPTPAASVPPYVPPPPPPPRRLVRSSRERMCAGVAGGMAEYFDIDPSLVRLLWVA